ncbi:YceI family protein [Blastomonas sp. AAP53]|uniref:YceI family protein n=1 Tax=Blastomonas sp. AAP53 TaxID=1248760 RepID=UPI0002D85A8A|nr:YceI family protein [Blastomonas sp. AAP53]
MIRTLAPALLLLPALALNACTPSEDKAEAPLPAGAWQLAADQSNVAFVSVKGGNVGEAHSFKSLEGSVQPDGTVGVDIDLVSVDTGVDVRNERMREMLFEVASFPQAKLTAKIDPATISGLKPGERKAMTVPVTLDLHGTTNSIDARLMVTRLAGDTVLVETAAPLILDAAAVGLGEGVEKLRAIANLPAISSAVPVTASLVFKPKV